MICWVLIYLLVDVHGILNPLLVRAIHGPREPWERMLEMKKWSAIGGSVDREGRCRLLIL